MIHSFNLNLRDSYILIIPLVHNSKHILIHEKTNKFNNDLKAKRKFKRMLWSVKTITLTITVVWVYDK